MASPKPDEKKLTLLTFKWPRARFVFALWHSDRRPRFRGGPSTGAYSQRHPFGLDGGFSIDGPRAWDLMDHYYVDRAAVQHLGMAYSAISGMTEALGDTNHSVF